MSGEGRVLTDSEVNLERVFFGLVELVNGPEDRERELEDVGSDELALRLSDHFRRGTGKRRGPARGIEDPLRVQDTT